MSTMLAKCDRPYPLVHSELVETTILSGAGGSADGCVAQLREISSTSVKLLVQGPPELSTGCRVRLVSSKLKAPLEFPAQIDWVRPNPAGDWLVECEFRPRMSEAAFAELLASGLLERRAAVRYQTRIPVQVQWLPGESRVSGIVRDLSEGGLCLCLVTREAPPETRDVCVIVTTSRGEVPLSLKIRWSLEVGRDYLIGCQFISSEDFEILRKLQPAREYLYEHSRAGKPASDAT
ncbi:MAG: PilZ domain-containing protein [Pirellulales bacterium]